MDANLVKRIAFAAVAIPLAVGLVWLGGWPLAALVALIGALGTRELFDIAAKQGVLAFRTTGIAAAALGPLLAYHAIADAPGRALLGANWIFLAAGFLILLLVQALLHRAPTERPLAAVAVTFLAVGYAGLLPTFLLGIRHETWPMRSWAGTALVFFPLVVTWVCDTAAMFGGRAVGGPKLAPTISPGKTRSGGIAGVVGGALIAPVFALWLLPLAGIEIGVLPAVAMAVALSVIGQVGDLAESLFKREAGVKDSSALIPGHGGVLDRFDSLYVILPTAALCYRLMGVL
jgi:phosphatidate cytidylyltransferase